MYLTLTLAMPQVYHPRAGSTMSASCQHPAQEDALGAWIEGHGRRFVLGAGETMWLSAAACGLYAYDWSRTARLYELLAAPATPILVSALPPELGAAAPLHRLGGLRFDESPRLAPDRVEGAEPGGPAGTL
jgi:hypothetical protein